MSLFCFAHNSRSGSGNEAVLLFRKAVMLSLILLSVFFSQAASAFSQTTVVHPWHGVKIGSGSPEICNAIIEIPKGSKNKYELDKPTGLLKLDRVLYASMHFPANYGFFPQTYFHDGDPLDVLVLSQEPIEPLTLVKVRIIGYLLVVDRGDRDTKIIAVPMKDPQFSHYTDISQIHENVIAEIKHFFEQYKKLEGKVVTAETTGGPAEAHQIIREGMDLYEKNRHLLNTPQNSAPCSK